MKNFSPSLCLFALLMGYFTSYAQTDSDYLLNHNRIISRNNPSPFNPDWAPFFHGVASGDPTESAVIIWTRVSPESTGEEPIQVSWKIASDPALENLIQSGNFTTNRDIDFTVKVDVQGLEAGKTYYYGFSALGKNSLTGKTKTTPTGQGIKHLKFGVVSCSNYQAGYFNAYRRLASRTDLDAIIHLGDYIYEYADGIYGDADIFEIRPLNPQKEIVTLEEYRTRYSTYRLDTSLLRLHQQHPIIAVWDDHESANNSWTGGAQNHSEDTEGDWQDRINAAKKAYFEWMPIRETSDDKVYRTIKYGDLMDLIMLDTRLEGREKQLNSILDTNLYRTDRTLLGTEQKAWFLNQLSNSSARWKVIGQQVIFSELNVGWASVFDTAASYVQAESVFLDIWDGYPAERTEIINYLQENSIDNVVILTGDFHSTFAFDVADVPVTVTLQNIPDIGDTPFYEPNENYNPSNGEGAIAVEFATPSVNSANFDENAGSFIAQLFQNLINTNIPVSGMDLGNPNPHMKNRDLIQHGYFILDVKPDSVQANWYYSPILEIAEEETFGEAWYTRDGENHLVVGMESEPKLIQDVPAPYDPPREITSTEEVTKRNFAILSIYPNPSAQYNYLHYALNAKSLVNIGLFSANGKLVRQLQNQEMQPGIYSLKVSLDNLSRGIYYYKIQAGKEYYSAKIVLQN